jgi:hypothetical protein
VGQFEYAHTVVRNRDIDRPGSISESYHWHICAAQMPCQLSRVDHRLIAGTVCLDATKQDIPERREGELSGSGQPRDAPGHGQSRRSTPIRCAVAVHPPAAATPPARPRGGVPRRVPDSNCVAALVFTARTVICFNTIRQRPW